jgi:SAM-dependent methyltransferase
MLYTYGIKLGIKLLLGGKLRQSLRYLIIPVSYWRNLEYQLVYNEADFQSNDRILDIGSPKLLSLYLAKKLGAEVFSTDIEDYFVQEYSFLRQAENIPPEKFHIKVEDGRDLSFDDNYFNKIYSISVIEHIPDNGDIECLKEIGRVLSKGGRCVITVPFSPTARVEYKEGDFYWAKSSTIKENGKVFFQRKYSEEDLFNRLMIPSDLKLKKLKYIGEKVMINSKQECRDVLHPATGPIQPLLSKLFHSKPVDSWKDLRKPLCALIVLEK